MLLDHAISHVERTFGRRVVTILIAKFVVPVRPQQTVVFSVEVEDNDHVSVMASVDGARVFSLAASLEGCVDGDGQLG
jgi:acyl-CoA thioesterase